MLHWEFYLLSIYSAIGDYSATTIGAMDRTPKDDELQRGIVGYGLSNVVAHCSADFPQQHTARTLVLLQLQRLSTVGYWDLQLQFSV